MKRLTYNRLAGAGLRAHGRQYVSLGLSVFLSVYLVASLCVAASGLFQKQRDNAALRVGYLNAFLLDSPEWTDAALRDTGYFDRLGHVYVTARLETNDFYLGYLDAEGGALLNRRCLAGRMPQRAGEIAVERGVLEQLRIEAEIGEELALSLLPIDGVGAETRRFTLVGLLHEQTGALDVTGFFSTSASAVLRFPALLVSPEEPAFASGRMAVHRVMTTRPLVDKKALSNNNRLSYLFVLGDDGGILPYWSGLDEQTGAGLVLLLLLGGALLLAACVAIAGAMESQLARKREEIGMFRAVGATRGQIRRIFGREVWLLSLLAAPLALGAGVLTGWALSRLAPDYFAFAPSPLLLAPIAAAAALCLLLSSWLPLRRAARIPPMGVLRDTALLRRRGRIRQKKRFRVPTLLCARQLRLHPGRQAGGVLMTALMIYCVFGLILSAVTGYQALGRPGPEFSLNSTRNMYYYHPYAQALPRATLSQADVAQIVRLPLVKQVRQGATAAVLAGLESVGEYLKSPLDSNFENALGFADEEEYIAARRASLTGVSDFLSDPFEEHARQNYRVRRPAYQAARDTLGTALELAELRFYVVTVDAERLEDYVAQGKIDLEALNAGEEVMVFAPERWRESHAAKNSYQTYRDTLEQPEAWTLHAVNDQFFAGDTLPLFQFFCYSDEESAIFASGQGTDAYTRQRTIFEKLERRQASPRIGAVLDGNLTQLENEMGVWMNAHDTAIITTPQGAQALGLETGGPETVSVYLSRQPDAEEESYLQSRLEQIALRGENMAARNLLKEARNRRAERLQALAALAGVVLIFFACSTGLMLGAASRRIQADRRAIGTLRAVGADAGVLLRGYAGPLWAQIVLGVALGAAGALLTHGLVPSYGGFPRLAALYLPCQLGFGALCGLCCQGMLRARLRGVLRQSIVENIREL